MPVNKPGFVAESGGKINIGGISANTTNMPGGFARFETTGTNSVIRFGSNVQMAENTAMKATLNGRFEAEGDLIIRTKLATNFDLADGILRMSGNGRLQGLEVAGTDNGIPTGALGSNFQIGLLQVGTNTQAARVILNDFYDNNNLIDNEALYLQGFPSQVGLRLLGGSNLILNGSNLYFANGSGGFISARTLINAGQISTNFDSGTISLTAAQGEIANPDFETQEIGWKQKGPGRIDVVSNLGILGNSVLQMTAGSPIEIYQHVSTMNSAFFIEFDARSLDATGTLSLLLDNMLLKSWTAADLAGSNLQSFSYSVDNPTFWGLIDKPLTFHWNANTGDRVWLDNIRMVTAVPEPSCALLVLGMASLIGSRRKRWTV